MSVVLRSLFPFPTSRVGIPNAIGEQPIQIGEVRIAAAVEAQPFAILLTGPFAMRGTTTQIMGGAMSARYGTGGQASGPSRELASVRSCTRLCTLAQRNPTLERAKPS